MTMEAYVKELAKRLRFSSVDGNHLTYEGGYELYMAWFPSQPADEDAAMLMFVKQCKEDFWNAGRAFEIKYLNDEDIEPHKSVTLLLDSTLYTGASEFELFVQAWIDKMPVL